MKISVIVSTYNHPSYLTLVLDSLKNQVNAGEYEIVIADDGSGPETKKVVEDFQKIFPVPLIHAWQKDLGFRLAASRNNACKLSSGDYLIFLDGDCIPKKDFVEKHRKLAEKGFFVTGTRVLLSQTFSLDLENQVTRLDTNNFFKLFRHFFDNHFNKIISVFYNPFFPRKLDKNNWKKLRGCNFAVWREDLFKVNGFDEGFTGWGFEDSDFAVRLINAGVRRKAGNFAVTVFHLYHKELKTKQEGPSWDRLLLTLKQKKVACKKGLVQTKKLVK